MELLLIWIIIAHATLIVALSKRMKLLHRFGTTSLRRIASRTLKDADSHLRVVLHLAEILLSGIEFLLFLLIKYALAILILWRIDFIIIDLIL
jgi:hypothetical protein